MAEPLQDLFPKNAQLKFTETVTDAAVNAVSYTLPETC